MAHEAGYEITLEREYGGTHVSVSTSKANSAWDCDMLVRVEKTERNIYSTQYFRSVEEMVTYERICS